MTDIVVGIRLKADGSGLVGQVRECKATVDQFGGSLASAGAQGKTMAGGTAAAEQAADALASASRAGKSAVDGLADSQRQANVALRGGATAANDHAKASNSSRNASMELEHVIRALSDSTAAGIDPLQALRMESGRVLEALSMMGGGASGVASLLMGPWGIAFQAAVAIAIPLGLELLKTDSAMEELKISSSALAEAQGALSERFDLQTGALKKKLPSCCSTPRPRRSTCASMPTRRWPAPRTR